MVLLRKHVAGLSDTALARFVARARHAVKLRGTVNVLVTGSQELRALNRRFRGIDQPTDVLSFTPEPSCVNGFAGDIAISAEIARANARRLGHSAAQEIRILALHGLLHLAGYDHERDEGVMAAKEVRLRRSLGLPAALIERNGQPGQAMQKPRGLSPTTRKKAKAAGGGARATPSTQARTR